MGEPKLQITNAELLAQGVPAGKLEAVRAALEKAVAADPSLNNWPTLSAMARGMKRFVGCDREYTLQDLAKVKAFFAKK